MTNYKVKLNGKELSLKLLEKEGSRLKFSISGNIYDISLESILSSGSSEEASSASDITLSKKEITAPMPGVIVKISAKEKQTLKAGQLIMSIEAMKMENNIMAPADCKIKKLHVKQGMEVKNNQILVTLE